MQRGPLLHRTRKGAAPAPPLGGADPVIRTPPGLPFQKGFGKKMPREVSRSRRETSRGIFPECTRRHTARRMSYLRALEPERSDAMP